MSQLDVPRVLESVANVAEHRDAKALRLSVLQTIGELLPVRATGFVRLGVAAPGGIEVLECDDLPAFEHEIPAGSLTRAARGESVRIPLNDGGCIHLIPVGSDEALAVQLGDCAPEQLRTIDALARLYRNFTAMIRDSEQDRLTGLRNRRSFDSYLARVTEASLATAEEPVPRDPVRARSGPLSWWLALFDVDHFKRINDRFGHLYGDEVLLLIAQMVGKLFRGEDRCFRYGGEEFAVVLSRSDHDGVLIAMERLRQAISTHVFPQIGQVTVSVGCAPVEAGLSMVEVIEHADRALYQAKKAGRNRVVFYEQARDGRRRDHLDGGVELF
jgi:diguanylate cyclase (GGDEF)-like protein